MKLLYELSENELKDENNTFRPEGSKLEFCRVISAAGVGSYKFDGRDVTYEAYEDILQKIGGINFWIIGRARYSFSSLAGVLVKARNFLVFQGDVESVASKSPLEITQLLEQIGGGDHLGLPAKYESLK